MKASDIIDRARKVLQDASATYWPDPEMLLWVADARGRMYELRPDLYEETQTLTLVAGPDQLVPAGADLLRLVANESHKDKREITITSSSALVRHRPAWRAMKPADEIVHYLYSETAPGRFSVYPPAVAGTTVSASVSVAPEEAVTATTDLAAEGSLATALVDYVLWRAFQKEADTVPAFWQRAQSHMEAFMQALVGDAQVEGAVSPNATQQGGQQLANGA